MTLVRRSVLSLCAFLLCLIAVPLQAGAASDPAVQQIEKFHDALLAMMKQGADAQTRFKKIAPRIDATFDLAAMTKFTVGTPWDAMSDTDHRSLIDAFRRMTVASYAHNFKSFNGEQFTVEPASEAHDADHLVKGQIIPAGDKPVALTYRMRQSAGAWKVIDVFLQGYVSQLATRRSEFASTIQDGGAAALVQKLNQLSDDLMKD